MKFQLNECLPTANAQLQGHWAVRHRQKKRLAQLIAQQVGLGPWFVLGRTNKHSKRQPVKAHVRILVGRPSRNLQDPDNRIASCKGLIDALRKTGWIYDDREKWIRLEVKEVRTERPGFVKVEVTRDKENTT